MTYALVDDQIAKWVERYGFKLFESWAGNPCRFVYLSSEAGECFQIGIEPPDAGEVQIYIRGIVGHREMDNPYTFQVPIEDFQNGLERAMLSIYGWMAPSYHHVLRHD